jgi:hypothetical protein
MACFWARMEYLKGVGIGRECRLGWQQREEVSICPATFDYMVSPSVG